VSSELGLCQTSKTPKEHPGEFLEKTQAEETLQRQAQAFPASFEISEEKAGKLCPVLCCKPFKDRSALELCLNTRSADGLLLLQPGSDLPQWF